MIRDRIIELVRVPAKELQAHPMNWREHPARQREALRALLEEIGYAAPLVGRRSRGKIILIDGHLRADLDPEQIVPVILLDVTAREATILLASLDPIGAQAASNDEALAALLSSVNASTEALAEFLAVLTPRLPLLDEDEIPQPGKPKTKVGELYALNEHRLLCGDATSTSDLDRLLEGGADALITDPPYGVDYEGKTRKRLRIRGDTRAGLAELLERSLAAASGHIAEGGPAYCFSPSGPGAELFMHAFAQFFRMRQTIVWAKDVMVPGHSDYHYQHELVLFGYAGQRARGRGKGGWYGGNNQTSLIEVAKPRQSDEHPTAKPLALIRRLLENSTRKDQLVLDCFAGSGSTLLACEQTGRRAALLEIDPAYCDVIIARFEAATGARARKIK